MCYGTYRSSANKMCVCVCVRFFFVLAYVLHCVNNVEYNRDPKNRIASLVIMLTNYTYSCVCAYANFQYTFAQLCGSISVAVI